VKRLEKDLTQLVSRFSDELVAQKWKCKGIMRNIYGAYAFRSTEEEVTIKDWKDISKALEKMGVEARTTGLKVEIERTKKHIRIRRQNVHTFPMKNGNYLVPMGGERGYLIGAMKRAIRTLGGSVRSSEWWGWQSYLGRGVIVTPHNVEVDGSIQLKTVDHIVELEGRGNKAIFEHYDCIPEANFEVVIEAYDPQGLYDTNEARRNVAILTEDSIPKLLSVVQKLGISPKRRGSIQWTRIIREK